MTDRRDVEVGKLDAGARELVQFRRLGVRIAVPRQIAIAKIVSKKQDDVGPVGGDGCRAGGPREEKGANARDSDNVCEPGKFHSSFS